MEAMSESRRPEIWGLGEFSGPELKLVANALSQQAYLRILPQGIEEAIERTSQRFQTLPQAIVAARSHPTAFQVESFEKLHSLLPLVPVVVVLGSLFAGERRKHVTNRSLRACYWQDAIAIFSRQQWWMQTKPGEFLFGLRTSTIEDLWTAHFERESLPSRHKTRVALKCENAIESWALASLLDAMGLEAQPGVTIQRENASPHLVVWSSSDLMSAKAKKHLQETCDEYRGAPVFALVSFVRAEEWLFANSLGVRQILGKPLCPYAFESAIASLLLEDSTIG